MASLDRTGGFLMPARKKSHSSRSVQAPLKSLCERQRCTPALPGGRDWRPHRDLCFTVMRKTSHMWLPLMPKLANNHTVIAADLRGAGQSSTPADGYESRDGARYPRPGSQAWVRNASEFVGHDIGLMVAYAMRGAIPFKARSSRIVLMDAFLPGVGKWRDVWLMQDLWHFHFYGKTPLCAGPWP